jgi:ribonuclease HII
MILIGVDEVGLGPAFGPVVACAYSPLPEHLQELEKVLEWGKYEGRDSKQRSPKQRSVLVPLLKEIGRYKIGVGSVREINEGDICRASLLAMKRAVEGLNINADQIFVDGRNLIPGIGKRRQSAVIKGDTKICAIAAASIIAKEWRDELITRLASWPQFSMYGLAQHKGYTTSPRKGEPGVHEEAIALDGASALHHRNNRAVVRGHNKFLGLDIPVQVDNQIQTTESQLCLQLQQVL